MLNEYVVDQQSLRKIGESPGGDRHFLSEAFAKLPSLTHLVLLDDLEGRRADGGAEGHAADHRISGCCGCRGRGSCPARPAHAVVDRRTVEGDEDDDDGRVDSLASRRIGTPRRSEESQREH